MDVSNHEKKPGRISAARLLPSQAAGRKLLSGSIVLLFSFCSLLTASAYGFTLTSFGGGAPVQLRPDDIVQDGVPLSAATEQVRDEGSLQTSLTDFSLPVDVNLAAALSGSTLTARIEQTLAFRVRLSRAERNRCLNDTDFEVDLRTVGAAGDAFSALDPEGGTLRLLRIDPVFRGARGNPRCPNQLLYGYTVDLSVVDALSAGTYAATAEIVVDLAGPGGSSQTLQIPLEVQMPGMLLLYHHSQIDVNLDVTALAGVLGGTRACSSGFCMDVGNRTLPVSSLAAPIAMNIASDAGTVVLVQTITLRDAVAARATGCSGGVYDTASYQILNAVGGVQPITGTIAGIQGAPCGLDIRSGDLSFDLDLSQVDAATGSASATIQITVTGL